MVYCFYNVRRFTFSFRCIFQHVVHFLSLACLIRLFFTVHFLFLFLILCCGLVFIYLLFICMISTGVNEVYDGALYYCNFASIVSSTFTLIKYIIIIAIILNISFSIFMCNFIFKYSLIVLLVVFFFKSNIM